jgi:hypothetical protein
MPGKHSRNKGHNFERSVVQEFRDMGWKEAKRHLETQWDSVELGIDLDGTEPYAIQCKRLRGYAPMNKLFEVTEKPGRVPILISKADRQPTLACMYWEDLKKLIRP